MALRYKNITTKNRLTSVNAENQNALGKTFTVKEATGAIQKRDVLGEIANKVQTKQTLTNLTNKNVAAKEREILKVPRKQPLTAKVTEIAARKETVVRTTLVQRQSETYRQSTVRTQPASYLGTNRRNIGTKVEEKPLTIPANVITAKAVPRARPNVTLNKKLTAPTSSLITKQVSSKASTSAGLLIGKIVVPQIPENLCITDIDKNTNEYNLGKYANEIYGYYRELEKVYTVEEDFLKGQDINSKMRAIVVDWLVDVQQQYNLLLETLHLSIGIFDLFLQKHRIIKRQKLQLVGVTAMWIASKFEELFAPELASFIYITDNAYSKNEMLKMEYLIHKTLDFGYGHPLSIHFLRRYSKAGDADSRHHTFAKFFLEIALLGYQLRHVKPSKLAAAALYIAFCVVDDDNEPGRHIWNEALTFYSTYTYDDLKTIIPVFAEMIIQQLSSTKLIAIQNKYASTKQLKVSVSCNLKSGILEKLANNDASDC